MAIDWTKVDGYKEEMTADEKLALLENQQQESDKPEPAPADQFKGYVPKAQLDKAASEIATLKKQLRGRMSDEEAKKADYDAQMEAMQNELAELRKEKLTSEYTARFSGLGMDAAMSATTAQAMIDGDIDALFRALSAHGANIAKATKTELLKNTPYPPAGEDNLEEAKKAAEVAKLRGYFGLK